MILEDFANTLSEIAIKNTVTDVAKHFNRERKWVYNVIAGCSFRLDDDVLQGLYDYGYELKLVKRGEETKHD